MGDMFKKVNAREKLIGWYHTGPKLRASDLKINELFKRYTPNPLLVIIDVAPKEIGVPTDAYFAVEEIKDDGTTTAQTFVHTPSVIVAEEAEEIGVEHLLRDIRDVAVGTLSTRITGQLQSLQGLHLRLRDIETYLGKVSKGELPVNHSVLGNLQDVFNLLPGLNAPLKTATAQAAAAGFGGVGGSGGHLTNGTALREPSGISSDVAADEGDELTRAMSVKTNDQLMSIYLSSLIRAITAFHDLIDNKVQNRQAADERAAKRDEGDGKSAKDKEEKPHVNGTAKEGEEKDKGEGADGKAENGKGKETKKK